MKRRPPRRYVRGGLRRSGTLSGAGRPANACIKGVDLTSQIDAAVIRAGLGKESPSRLPRALFRSSSPTPSSNRRKRRADRLGRPSARLPVARRARPRVPSDPPGPAFGNLPQQDHDSRREDAGRFGALVHGCNCRRFARDQSDHVLSAESVRRGAGALVGSRSPPPATTTPAGRAGSRAVPSAEEFTGGRPPLPSSAEPPSRAGRRGPHDRRPAAGAGGRGGRRLNSGREPRSYAFRTQPNAAVRPPAAPGCGVAAPKGAGPPRGGVRDSAGAPVLGDGAPAGPARPLRRSEIQKIPGRGASDSRSVVA